MKVLLINVVCGIGSTGRICGEIAKKYIELGHECYIAYGRGNVPVELRKYAIKIGGQFDIITHLIYTRLFDRHGFGSQKSTQRFLAWVDQYKPDLIWLHNIHGYYINIDLLFGWLQHHPEVKVKWTLHDCWAFTGHCCHFSFVGCSAWKSGCKNCLQKESYPRSYLISNSENNYKRKKELFTSLKCLDIVVPSKWLANLVGESFLGKYPVEVRYNSINREIFKPTLSDYKTRYGLINKHILLGVANDWNDKKGLGDFIKLAFNLDKKYAILMVGIKTNQIRDICQRFTNIKLSWKQTLRWSKPICIYSIHDSFLANINSDSCITIAENSYEGASVFFFPHLGSAQELAKFYTVADLFINTTYEDTYPTVNLEAQACGTNVLTYKTGGSVESVPAKNHVEQGDIKGLINKIKSYCEP